ncbi:BUD13 homolog [Anopheles merus]|uniref:BUD13 homolog n=1 Tax=Anopheles merus TaxID=30066 RepID=UPI001BE4BE94|nr:BUD13 homolog [Anopheles merus]
MAAKIDQKEYLKRYLSNDKDAKKKKKKKDKLKAAKKANVVIVDDDLDLSALQSRIDDNETDLFGLDEEAPQVVGIIDERPPELRAKEDFSSAKWKALNANDGGFDGMLRANESTRPDGDAEARVSFKAQGAKTERRRKYDSDESPPRQQKGSRRDRRGKDSDESPPRRRASKEKDVSRGRNKRDDSDESAARKSATGKSRKRHDSDESPPRRGRSKEKEDTRRMRRDDDSDESPPRKTDRRNHQDPDESPPRRGKSKEKEVRKKGKQDDTRESTRKNYDSDVSPPRRRRSKEKDDARRKRRGDDSDESPPRKTGTSKNARKLQDSDESPPRRRISKEKDISRGKGRRDESDESPPRRKAGTEKRNDTSLPRKRRQHDSDESPPRRREEKAPERRKQRHDSIESPPRRHRDKEHRERDKREVRHRSSDTDESPPGRKEYDRKKSSNRRQDSDESPPRHSRAKEAEVGRSQTVTVKRERRHYDSDESPPRRSSRRSPERRQQQPSHSRTVSPPVRIKQERKSSDSDLSPPRKSTRPQDRDSPPRSNRTREPSQLVEQRSIKREPRSPSTSVSRHAPAEKMAKTLDGKRAGLQDAKSLREENEQHRAREREALMKLSDEMSGRYAETVVREKGGRRRDVEKELREELAKRKHDEKKKEIYTRWGKGVKQVEDYRAQLEEAAREMEKPLARYADDKDLDEHLKQQEREGDPMLEYLRSKRREENKRAGIPEKPVYQGAFPDNRYGIRPGYRWDGVDRSNGFEKRWFETMSKKKAVEEEAYKYSVEDM